MARINLLPWREKLKEQQMRHFYTLIFVYCCFAIMLLGFWWLAINSFTADQLLRNQYLEDEIALVNIKITQIQKIQNRKLDIAQRADIILQLQRERNLPTQVFIELVKVVPTGVTLTKVNKLGTELIIEGWSTSNNQLSNMMRAIKASKWLNDPQINSISNKEKMPTSGKRFLLNVTIVNVNTDDQQGVADAS
ncbi:PilN domain-containing protein [Paraferrimonas sp. SM1919]|uniref:PilN domain-containing protein n=1 Tax=Paraferrimonas sp. SM1919 TaxID=2662263 RepID=UPI0013D07828|nr:PilN domain-containing protein [Paraferrimonas sp. SM1919]